MMTQGYPYGGEIEHSYRALDRNMSNGHYYERSVQYDHHPYSRRNHRSEYVGRHSTRTMIHEPETAGGIGHGRKRIGVAVSIFSLGLNQMED